MVSRIPNQTLKGVAAKPIPKVKVGKNTLKAGRDFTVSFKLQQIRLNILIITRSMGQRQNMDGIDIILILECLFMIIWET